MTARTIIAVRPNTPEMDAVIALWRVDSDTLGYMPKGGFEDAAREEALLAAIDDNGNVLGYVLFRRTQDFAAIAHLCISRERRGTGLVRVLFEAVKARCAREFEIRLRCRRDFAVAALWPKLGFVAAGEAPGRGLNTILTLWRYELVAPPILSLLSRTSATREAIKAVIDANVFFGLAGLDAQDEQSRALAADWLGDFVELSVTEEIFNEIDRRDDQAERQAQRARAGRFLSIPRNVEREEAILPKVRDLLGTTPSPSKVSDARQVAMTIAGGVGTFVTCDKGILSCVESFDREFGLQIREPYEVVRQFDELRRQRDYQPQRLFVGPQIRAAAARSQDLSPLATLMHEGQSSPPEPRRQTIARLKTYLAQPDTFRATCIWKGDELLAAHILERPSSDLMRVPFMGVAQSFLGSTAARHFLQEIVTTAARERRSVTEVLSSGDRLTGALLELGFSKLPPDDTWIKVGATRAGGLGNAIGFLERIAGAHPRTVPLVSRVSNLLRTVNQDVSTARTAVAEIERILWPLKVSGSGTRSFVVPIQARWARELFDRELAAGTLFGATPTIALNAENVYYRSARTNVLTAPSRVLWYVSLEKGTPGTMAVRACSRIDEVVVGRPKELFARFRRLGIYQWSDIFALAGRNLETEIMAFRFSGTELFEKPVPRQVVQLELGSRRGKGTNPLMSPVEISEDSFFAIYNRGVGADATT